MSHTDPNAIFPVPADWTNRAGIDAARYADMYRRSIEDPHAVLFDLHHFH